MLFEASDLIPIGTLVFLEGILSLDNALVLALMVRHLPSAQQKKALTYGMVGAVGFRFLALSLVTFLMKWTWVKFLGSGYLLFIAGQYFFSKADDLGSSKKIGVSSFWKTVLLIELTDVAFAVDSILASIAVSKKFAVVFVGGVLGIFMMRVAASFFVKLLDRFPRLERTAYLLITVIALKLILEGFRLETVDFHSAENPAYWSFWGLMALSILSGFQPTAPKKT